MRLSPSAHLDTFCRDRLPTQDQWPEFRFDLPELNYPERLNCAVELLDATAALEHGLVTFTPDELDWQDEIRVAIEERASLSPDALTGLEANLRFAGPETVATKIFGRLSAWQNWIFTRPNATGEQVALKRYGSGARARFDWERI